MPTVDLTILYKADTISDCGGPSFYILNLSNLFIRNEVM